MRYTSTRDSSVNVPFETAVLSGISPSDGGLYVPCEWPTANSASFAPGLSYGDVAHRLVRLFVHSGEVSDEEIDRVVRDSSAPFADPNEPVHLTWLSQQLVVLELWHGPTLSFKDVAMQFVLQMQQLFLQRDKGIKRRRTLLVATTGDTGAAAIHAARSVPEVECFVLYTRGRVTPRQELQMLQPDEPNVHAVSVPVTSDELDVVLRRLFADGPFAEQYALSTVNSFNWARVMYQAVYYIWAYLKVNNSGSNNVTFVVPSGGFGNGFAAVLARHVLGQGAAFKIVGATNANDILVRLLAKGDGLLSVTGTVRPTLSSCMDIMVPSNLERLVYFAALTCPDPSISSTAAQLTGDLMVSLTTSNSTTAALPDQLRRRIAGLCSFTSVDDDATAATVASVARSFKYLVDPHTAVAVHAANSLMSDDAGVVVCCSTASPAKFIDTVTAAAGRSVLLPASAHVDKVLLEHLVATRALKAESIDETETLLRRLVAARFVKAFERQKSL